LRPAWSYAADHVRRPMSWASFRVIAAGLFVVFALLLIALPLQRIAVGRLRFAKTWGFIVAGAGFAALAAGLLWLPDARANNLLIGGVIATVIGNMVQQQVRDT
jgi:hypothetical protein